MSQSSNVLSFVSANSESASQSNALGPVRPWPVSGVSEADETLHRIAEAALSATSASGAALALRKGENVVCLARAGAMAPPLGAKLDDTSGISGECLRTGLALQCEDTEKDTRVDAEACRSLGLRSLAVAAIKDGEKVLGILEVFSPRPHAFTDRHMDVLRQLAELVLETSEDNPAEASLAPASQVPTPEPAAVAVLAPPPPKPEMVAAVEVTRPEIEPALPAPVAGPSKELTSRPPSSVRPIVSATAAPATPSTGDVNISAYMAAHEKTQLRRPSRAAYLVLIGLATVLVASVVTGWWLGHRSSQIAAAQPIPAAVAPSAASVTDTTVVLPSPPAATPAQTIPETEASSGTKSHQPKSAKSGQESLTKAASLDRVSNTRSEVTKPIRVVSPSPTNVVNSESAPALASLGTDNKGTEAVSRLLAAPISLPKRPLPVSQGVAGGEIERKVAAIYPQQARSVRQQGTVVLDTVVGEDGSVHSVNVVSGPPLLRQAAADAAKQWKYKPFQLNGQPVTMQTQVTFDFKLE
jgi:TonB family protein